MRIKNIRERYRKIKISNCQEGNNKSEAREQPTTK
jgi:hypothetical protein